MANDTPTLKAFDHVNLRTTDPEGLADWYETHLGLARGWRPPFPFPGAWLYLGDSAVVHVVGVTDSPGSYSGSLEHFAFTATGMDAFAAKLDAAGVPFQRADVPGTDIVQFNLHDPAGNHIHIDFRTANENA